MLTCSGIKCIFLLSLHQFSLTSYHTWIIVSHCHVFHTFLHCSLTPSHNYSHPTSRHTCRIACIAMSHLVPVIISIKKRTRVCDDVFSCKVWIFLPPPSSRASWSPSFWRHAQFFWKRFIPLFNIKGKRGEKNTQHKKDGIKQKDWFSNVLTALGNAFQGGLHLEEKKTKERCKVGIRTQSWRRCDGPEERLSPYITKSEWC